MKPVSKILIIGLFSLGLLIMGGTALAAGKITVYGKPFSPRVFVADDGQIYHIVNKDMGMRLFAISDIWASNVRLIGTLEEENGKLFLHIDKYERFSQAWCYPYGCFGPLSDTPSPRVIGKPSLNN